MDTNLYSDRFTTAGYKAYWEAIDKTIRYFDSVILKKNERMRTKSAHNINKQELFKWQNPALNSRLAQKSDQQRLPPPPEL